MMQLVHGHGQQQGELVSRHSGAGVHVSVTLRLAVILWIGIADAWFFDAVSIT